MSHRKKISRLLIISIVFIIVSLLYDYIIAKLGHINWIDYIDGKYTESIVFPLFLITLALLPLLLLLLLNKPAVYNAWKKFAIPYLIVYVFLALPLGNISGDGIYSGASPSVGKETGIMFLVGLFFIISLLIIIIQSIKLAGKPETAKPEKKEE